MDVIHPELLKQMHRQVDDLTRQLGNQSNSLQESREARAVLEADMHMAHRQIMHLLATTQHRNSLSEPPSSRLAVEISRLKRRIGLTQFGVPKQSEGQSTGQPVEAIQTHAARLSGGSIPRDLFVDPPLLHSWDGGQTWNTGGFTGQDLNWLWRLATETPDPAIAETGAGCSTLALLMANPRSLTSVANDQDVYTRIRSVAPEYGVPLSAWNPLEGRSEEVLLRLVCSGTFEPIDLALIDGGHGWPTVFLDFHFLNLMMHKGSILLLDDIELHSVGELARFLTRQPDWEWVGAGPSEKTIALRRLSESALFPDWGGQPYIVEALSKQQFGLQHYNLGINL